MSDDDIVARLKKLNDDIGRTIEMQEQQVPKLIYPTRTAMESLKDSLSNFRNGSSAVIPLGHEPKIEYIGPKKSIKCENCAGPLDGPKCKYCGSVYEKSVDPKLKHELDAMVQAYMKGFIREEDKEGISASLGLPSKITRAKTVTKKYTEDIEDQRVRRLYEESKVSYDTSLLPQKDLLITFSCIIVAFLTFLFAPKIFLALCAVLAIGAVIYIWCINFNTVKWIMNLYVIRTVSYIAYAVSVLGFIIWLLYTFNLI